MRIDFDTLREIGDSLTRNKRRTLLTGFGVFWGLFMLLFMIGGGHGLKNLLMENFAGFASNTVVTVATPTSKPYKGLPEGRTWSMEMNDIERLRQMVPEIGHISPMISAWGSTVEHGEYTASRSNVKGVSQEYSFIAPPSIKYGRYLNGIDIIQERKVCVIGKRIYQELFPDGGDPCGEFIKVGSIYMQVVGVDFSSGNMSINGSTAETILMPYTVAAKIYNRGSTIDLICFTGKNSIRMSPIEPHIREVFARQHDFATDDNEALMILNTEQIFQIIDNLMRGLDFLIWLVGLGTLLAGCIGVSNIMMVTVKERTVEIGIRRAIGAMPWEILSQILAESIALTVAAGSGGIVLSVLFQYIMSQSVGDGASFLISFWTAVMSAVMLAALGALAGLAPALRAMAIKPVDAMRDE